MADNSFKHLVAVGSSDGGIGALLGLVTSLPEGGTGVQVHLPLRNGGA